MLKKSFLNSISNDVFADEKNFILEQIQEINFAFNMQDNIKKRSSALIKKIQNSKKFSVEQFLQEYSLSSDEGVAVMCLAESLIRIPDDATSLELALDKLSDKDWSKHIMKSQAKLINIASMGLFVSGSWSDFCSNDNLIINLIKRLGTPVFLLAIKKVIFWLGFEFVIGETILKGLKNTRKFKGYKFSFDLLGESARTFEQAEKYYEGYLDAVDKIAASKVAESSLSVKLTALYPRFELTKIDDVESYLIPRLVKLIKKMMVYNIAITFDAEESYRLEAYMRVVTALVMHPEFKNFSSIGFVVQAYQKRAGKVIDYIIELAKKTGKRIPIRLVKGAYWDAEIKYAQTAGLPDYPVFTCKELTDANYLIQAKKIFENESYITAQFATHNAITASSIIEISKGRSFEFQKLHGMGGVLHKELHKNYDVRIYAPIGKMEDLLAYLMRRLLENGANSSFVHQVSSIENEMTYDLHKEIISGKIESKIVLPINIYTNRKNSIGYELGYNFMQDKLKTEIDCFKDKIYKVGSIIDGREVIAKHVTDHFCPARLAEKIGDISISTETAMISSVDSAKSAFEEWSRRPVRERADILRNIADLLEENQAEVFSLLIREAGKSIQDAIAELREAVDFCRYYASQAEAIMKDRHLPGITGESNVLTLHGRGVFLCISPWNFPLAIFTGQIVAALVSGNSVIAKPSDQTSIIASVVVKLMHKGGVPTKVLQLLLASGSAIGKYVVTNPDIAGVVFTGSTATAKIINSTLSARPGAIVPIIAETGGQNAMIVDSSALLEQVTDDVLMSAFYSAGQRCSALRVLYIQDEIYDSLVEMLIGAMAALKIGDTSDFANDIGPVIDKASFEHLTAHIKDMEAKGFKIIASHPQKGALKDGHYFYPHIIEINNINDLEEEKFGPILHLVRYKYADLDKIINEVNGYGFGLTFGIHSRIESKIEYIRSKIKAGNIYVNRSIIGAVVESQPFGGENQSGTGFKAGGPHYLLKFMLERTTTVNLTAIGGNIELLK